MSEQEPLLHGARLMVATTRRRRTTWEVTSQPLRSRMDLRRPCFSSAAAEEVSRATEGAVSAHADRPIATDAGHQPGNKS